MSSQQLDNLKKKLGAFPQLEQNGRLLHIHKPLVHFHEWSVLTYNLNVLGDIIRENMELHKKLHLLTDRYVKQVETLSSSSRSSLSETGLGSPNPSAAITMVNQKIKDVGKRLDRLEDLMINKLAGSG